MAYWEKFRKETFCKHPLEDCVVRIVPTSKFSVDTYLMFPGRYEYKPVRSSNIVLQVLLAKELEYITEEEYWAVGKKREPYVYEFPPDPKKAERIGGIQSLILDLAAGRKKPSNEKERRLLRQIKAMEARGYMLDLPLE